MHELYWLLMLLLLIDYVLFTLLFGAGRGGAVAGGKNGPLPVPRRMGPLVDAEQNLWLVMQSSISPGCWDFSCHCWLPSHQSPSQSHWTTMVIAETVKRRRGNSEFAMQLRIWRWGVKVAVNFTVMGSKRLKAGAQPGCCRAGARFWVPVPKGVRGCRPRINFET